MLCLVWACSQCPRGRGNLLWFRAWTFRYVRSYCLSKFHSGRLSFGNLKNHDWYINTYSPNFFSNRAESKLLKQLERNEKKMIIIKGWVMYQTGFDVHCILTDIGRSFTSIWIHYAVCRHAGRTRRQSYACTAHCWMWVPKQSSPV